MSSMRGAKTISITLPPDLLLKAQETAQREHRTMSEALRRYMNLDRASALKMWQDLREYGDAKARVLEIASETM